MGYGTGAIMGVPAHDERDLEFARKFDLPIHPMSCRPPGETRRNRSVSLEDGIAINSPLINGLPTPEAKERITAWLEERGTWSRTTQLQTPRLAFLASALLGRTLSQSSGEKENTKPIAESELPLVPPPLDDFKPTGHRRAAAGASARMGALLGNSDARAEHDAAMGGLLLVLPALLRSHESGTLCRRRSGALLDGRREMTNSE